MERIAELEQAFALTKELDESYMELNEWMDQVEQELHACEPITTGMNPKSLFQQQNHNNVHIFSYFFLNFFRTCSNLFKDNDQ